MELSKPVKIGISIMALIIIVGIIYYVFGGSDKTDNNGDETSKLGPASEGRDPYYSKDTFDRIRDNDFGKFTDFNGQDHADAFWGGMAAAFGEKFDDEKDVNKKKSTFIIAWFKGMDLYMNGTYVSYFKDDISKYINSSKKMVHWDVKQGAFIK